MLVCILVIIRHPQYLFYIIKSNIFLSVKNKTKIKPGETFVFIQGWNLSERGSGKPEPARPPSCSSPSTSLRSRVWVTLAYDSEYRFRRCRGTQLLLQGCLLRLLQARGSVWAEQGGGVHCNISAALTPDEESTSLCCRQPQVWGHTPSGTGHVCSWHREQVRECFGVVCACVICGCTNHAHTAPSWNREAGPRGASERVGPRAAGEGKRGEGSFSVECCFLPLKEEKSLPGNLEETGKPTNPNSY